MFQYFSQIGAKIQSRWNKIVISFGDQLKNLCLCETEKDRHIGFQDREPMTNQWQKSVPKNIQW